MLSSKACDQCYRCKLKCNKHQPTCERCSSSGIACTYSFGKFLSRPKSSKRKREPQSEHEDHYQAGRNSSKRHQPRDSISSADLESHDRISRTSPIVMEPLDTTLSNRYSWSEEHSYMPEFFSAPSVSSAECVTQALPFPHNLVLELDSADEASVRTGEAHMPSEDTEILPQPAVPATNSCDCFSRSLLAMKQLHRCQGAITELSRSDILSRSDAAVAACLQYTQCCKCFDTPRTLLCLVLLEQVQACLSSVIQRDSEGSHAAGQVLPTKSQVIRAVSVLAGLKTTIDVMQSHSLPTERKLPNVIGFVDKLQSKFTSMWTACT